MATYNINISDLATTLQNADANTVDTPHTINISEITQNDVDNGTIRTCLLNNPTKYVIINILAGSTVTDVSFLFGHYNTQPYCTSLIGADISALTNATTAQYTFQCCTNIKSANISKLDKVTRTQFCFAYCTSLKSVYCDNLYSLRFAGSMFNSCSSLTDVDVTSFRNVIAAEYLFYRCTALTEIDTSGFVSLNSAREMFNGCTALTEIDISSMNRLGVLSYMFQNCTNLETITLPDLSSVTEAGSMFNGCSSLEEIHGWSVPLTATMTDCFTGCTSLQAIYVPEVVPQESTWHAWDIKKDTANTRSDVTIYGTSGIPVTAQIPSSGTYSLEVTGMTDELLFSSTKAITSAHIQKMMQTQTPITGNTDALDPTKDNFVMLAKDRTAAKTNVTTDVVEAGNLLPPTSAAVHAAIDANKSGGIPLGGWTSFENDTAPNDDWIQAGTTFDSDTYPELFLYLGGNTVPERYDHSRLDEACILDGSDTLHPLLSTTNFVCPYDGVIIVNFSEGGYTGQNALVINNTSYCGAFDIKGSDTYDSVTVNVKSGDLVKTYRGHSSTSGSWAAFARWYTHPMFIKATTTASSYTPSTAVQEIKDYTKDYVDASNSYSTEETLTGGTWIDGKPIYRKVFTGLNITLSSTSWTNTTILKGDIGQIISCHGMRESDNALYSIDASRCSSNSNYLQLAYYGGGSYPSNMSILIIEYTKTTD